MNKNKRIKVIIGSALLTILLLLSGCTPVVKQEAASIADGEMLVTYIDIGQGDATLIQTAGHSMLIDTGKYEDRETLLTQLENEGVETIDYFILTHPDADHIGSGNVVLDEYEVEHVIMPDVAKDTKAYTYTLEAIDEEDTELIRPAVGDEYTVGDARFIIVSPETADAGEVNDASVGIKLVHGDNSFLFCGDAEENSEKVMVSGDISLECDVLKVSHHGSRTATSDTFLAAADPTWAVISCGADNQYGMPHAEVLSKLEDDDVQVYRTDTLGSITAASDGQDITWTSAEKSSIPQEADVTPTPEAETAPAPETAPAETPENNTAETEEYILNTNTKKIHRLDCSSVEEIYDHNKEDYSGTKEALEAEGYTGCQRCNP